MLTINKDVHYVENVTDRTKYQMQLQKTGSICFCFVLLLGANI